MNSVIETSRRDSKEGWPDDEVLTEYLLGTLPSDDRFAIETWLGEEPIHAERLCELSETLLSISKVTYLFVADDGRNKQISVFSTAIYRRLGIALAMAATAAVVLFSIDGFQPEDADQTRIAMVWAESLAATDEETPDWLLESNPIDSTWKPESEELLVSEEFVDEDGSETQTVFGFSSDDPSLEPPDWLLAGVMMMETSGATVEVEEALQ